MSIRYVDVLFYISIRGAVIVIIHAMTILLFSLYQGEKKFVQKLVNSVLTSLPTQDKLSAAIVSSGVSALCSSQEDPLDADTADAL